MLGILSPSEIYPVIMSNFPEVMQKMGSECRLGAGSPLGSPSSGLWASKAAWMAEKVGRLFTIIPAANDNDSNQGTGQGRKSKVQEHMGIIINKANLVAIQRQMSRGHPSVKTELPTWVMRMVMGPTETGAHQKSSWQCVWEAEREIQWTGEVVADALSVGVLEQK